MNSPRRPQHAAIARTALGCVAVIWAGTAAAQDVELRWKLEAGADLVYRISMESETELPQGLGTTTMEIESTHRWSVLEVDEDAQTTVEVTTERTRVSMDGPMGAMSADSADAAGSGSPFEAVRAMAGLRYGATFDSRGALIEMSGTEELREALRTTNPDSAGQAMMDQMLSEEALRAQWEQGVSALPADPVGIGSTWEQTFDWPLAGLGSMTVTVTNEVEAIDGDLVVIASSGTAAMADHVAPSLPVAMNFRDATIQGTSRFDAGRGLQLGGETSFAFEAAMAIAGRESVMSITGTATMELVEE